MPDSTPPAEGTATVEIGMAGLKHSNGRVQEEWLPALKGKQGAAVYREMIDNDPIIGGIQYAIEETLRSVSWVTGPYDDSPEALADAEFLDECREDMSMTWGDFIGDSLSKMGYGWSAFETVYKRRLGKDPGDGAAISRFDDNRLGWRKFAFRSQDTLERWEIDDDGGIRGMWQTARTTGAPTNGPGSNMVFIPIEKMMLFRTTTRKGNPEGRSIFRNAYLPWWTKKRVEWFELIGVERDLAGIPSFGIPPEFFAADAPDEMRTALDGFTKAATQLRRDEQSALVWPKYQTENGVDRIEIGLLKSPGGRQQPTNEIIERNSRWMAIATLQDIIMLGHENVGSFALADVKKQVATTALRAQLDEIANVLNRHEIPRLFRLNGLDTTQLPELIPGEIETRDVEKLIGLIEATAKAGMEWFPNEEIEREVLTLGGFDPTKVAAAAEREDEDSFAPTPPVSSTPDLEEDEGLDDGADVDIET